MSVYSIVVMVCLASCAIADPLSPYMGITWVTDDVSLSFCRSGCQNLCCPVNSTLSVQGVNNNLYLFVNIDSQSASKCGATTYTTYSSITGSSSDSSGAKFSGIFMGISFDAVIDANNNNELTYTFPIPGGNGKCVLDAPNSVSIIGVPPGPSSTSDTELVKLFYGLVILCTLVLFLS